MPTPSGVLKRITPYSVLLLALLLTVQSCGDAEDSSQPSGRVGIAYQVPLRCSAAITQWSPPGPDLNTLDPDFPDFEVVGGVAALQTSKSSQYAPSTVSNHYYRHGPYSEDPTLQTVTRGHLLVRRESSFTLRVPEDFHDRVAFEWGSSHVPAHRLEVGPCESETEWLFSFGLVSCPSPSASPWRSYCLTPRLKHSKWESANPVQANSRRWKPRAYPSPEPCKSRDSS